MEITGHYPARNRSWRSAESVWISLGVSNARPTCCCPKLILLLAASSARLIVSNTTVFLPEQTGDEVRSLLVVDAEHLKDTGVGEEGSGALAVECLQLVDAPHDRSERDFVVHHQPHRALDQFEMAQHRDLVEQEQHGKGRCPNAHASSVRACATISHSQRA